MRKTILYVVMGLLLGVAPVCAQDSLLTDSVETVAAAELEALDDDTEEVAEGGSLHKQLKRKFMEGSAGFMSLVALSLDGGEIISYDIKLSQWLNYCKEQDYQVYFAIEEVREDGMLAIVVAHCQELNYNHLASVLIPNDFVIKPQTVLKAKITPFIPTHNVKNLYQQQMTKHKKRKW